MNMSKTILLAVLGSILLLSLLTPTSAKQQASASHILVSTEEEAKTLLAELEGGADFADLAREHSSCPSSKKGGSLGTFSPGQMVKEFNDVVFQVSHAFTCCYLRSVGGSWCCSRPRQNSIWISPNSNHRSYRVESLSSIT